MMDGLLDEAYFKWLYAQVSPIRLKNPARTHWSLLRQLYKKEFVWFIPNDDNRVEDGKDLRREFIESINLRGDPDPVWMSLGCSILEMLIALSRRLSFEAEGEPRDWFWHMLENVDLQKYTDKYYDQIAERDIDQACDIIIFRTYAPNGRGGLFPLRNPVEDQRNVELWYQFNAYLVELS